MTKQIQNSIRSQRDAAGFTLGIPPALVCIPAMLIPPYK